MTTYIRTPCRKCGGTEFYKSDYRCVWCKNAQNKQRQQSEVGRKYHRDYMRKRRNNPQFRHQEKVSAYMREQGRAV